MKIFGLKFLNKLKKNKTPVDFRLSTQSQLQNNIQDKLAIGPKQTINIAKIPRVKNPAISFKLRPGADTFEAAEYDMAEIGRIEDVEAYVQRAFTQKEGLMFKEDWELVGKNPQTIKYIKQRFEQFSVATGEPFANILHGIGEDLIRYSNAFLVKVRNQKASGGKTRLIPGTDVTVEPVAGYFALPVSTVRFKRDDNGKILKYRQMMPSGQYKDFNPRDIVHIYFRRKKGFLVGTPSLIPVKDDIRALRRIEENIEMLIYQHLFPLYHYTVGSEEAPAMVYADGTREIDIVKQEVEIMPAEGMIVTPERHKVTAVGAEGRALRAEGYLKHFKQRIFAGLGVSAVDMGEGDTSNRSTADSMSRNLVDDVKHYQQICVMFLNQLMINELLLESTFSNPLDDENLVYVSFNEIDVDSKVKIESHAIQAFSGHAITHSELRNAYGKEPLTEEEWNDTYYKRITEPQLIAQSVANASVSPEETPGQRTAKVKSRPINQYGQKTGPEKRKSSVILADQITSDTTLNKLYSDLFEQTMYTIQNNTFTIEWFKQLTLATSTLMQERLLRLARIEFRNNFRSVTKIDPEDLIMPFAILESRIENIISRFISILATRIINRFSSDETFITQQSKLISIFDALEFRNRFIHNTMLSKASNYGIVRGLKKLRHIQAKIQHNENACQACINRDSYINVQNATIDDVPGYHTNCTCKIVPVNKNDNLL